MCLLIHTRMRTVSTKYYIPASYLMRRPYIQQRFDLRATYEGIRFGYRLNRHTVQLVTLCMLSYFFPVLRPPLKFLLNQKYPNSFTTL